MSFMVDLTEPPNVEDSVTKIRAAEREVESMKQDVNGVLDMQISDMTKQDMGVAPTTVPEYDQDLTGMSDPDDWGIPQKEQRPEDKEYVERERNVAADAKDANDLTTQMGEATIAILKLLNYYDAIKKEFTLQDLEITIPQLTGLGINRDLMAELLAMLMTRDFITPEPRFGKVPVSITPKGRAFLILDYNLSNVGNL